MIRPSAVATCIMFLVPLPMAGCSEESPWVTAPEATPHQVQPSLASDPGNEGDLALPDQLPFGLTVERGSTYPDLFRTDPCLGARFPMVMEGEGVGSHVGRFSFWSSVCSDGTTWTEGQGTLTAANGDHIHFGSAGWMTGPVSWTETETLDEGTGRFARAEGELTMVGEIFPEFDETGQPVFPMRWAGRAEGWISYQASDRGDTPGDG